MQEAALEGLDAHDGFSLMAEALLHHQITHVLFLDVNVAVLPPQRCHINTSCQSITQTFGPLNTFSHREGSCCRSPSPGAWFTLCFDAHVMLRLDNHERAHLERRAKDAGPQLAIIIIIQLTEHARQGL